MMKTAKGVEEGAQGTAKKEDVARLRERVFKEHWNLAQKHRHFLLEPTFQRYLVAREGNVDEALDMLVASLKWRQEWKPEEITSEEVKEDIVMCKMYIQGQDKQGRPVVIFKPANDVDGVGSILTKVRFYVWVLESAIKRMPSGLTQMVWLVDMNGYRVGPSDLKRVKLARALLETLQNQYPERVAKLILVKPPWYFRVLLTIMKPFLSQRTLDKLVTDNGSGATYPKLEQLIGEQQLETTYGGVLPVPTPDSLQRAAEKPAAVSVETTAPVTSSPSGKEEEERKVEEGNDAGKQGQGEAEGDEQEQVSRLIHASSLSSSQDEEPQRTSV